MKEIQHVLGALVYVNRLVDVGLMDGRKYYAFHEFPSATAKYGGRWAPYRWVRTINAYNHGLPPHVLIMEKRGCG